MDWYAWLSKTGLDPSVIYNYAIIFNQNELEEDDLVYFNHEMLQSMGISIAKHRLEILNIKMEKNNNMHHFPIWWLILAMKQTKKYVSKQVQELVKNKKDSSLSIVPKQCLPMHRARWKMAMLKRNKNYVLAKQENNNIPSNVVSYGRSPVVQSKKILMLTNGSPLYGSSSPMVYDFGYYQKGGMMDDGDDDDDDDDGGCEYFEADNVVHVEDIKWHAMFQDLKPT